MIKCDLHIHSKYSFDSLANPKKIVDLALRRGLQCIAIADHGNISGSLEAAAYARKNSLPILIIISEEVKSKSGDILGLNIKEPIPDHIPAQNAIDRIHAQGGIAVAAHPFGLWCGFTDNLEDYAKQIDGVEILNASVFAGNETAEIFAEKHNLAFTAGSDAHFTNHFIGKTWLELPLDYSPDLTAAQVISAIKQKKGAASGRQASFLQKAIDHPFRSLTKLKTLFIKK
ncbi:MAG: CehA/McbA family metallohydrolase [Candidatus Paceibacterota bacterium]